MCVNEVCISHMYVDTVYLSKMCSSGRGRIFSLHLSPDRFCGPQLQEKSGRSVQLTTHLSLRLRLRMHEALSQSPINLQGLVLRRRDSFTFTLHHYDEAFKSLDLNLRCC
jgi:hypothetical protein